MATQGHGASDANQPSLSIACISTAGSSATGILLCCAADAKRDISCGRFHSAVLALCNVESAGQQTELASVQSAFAVVLEESTNRCKAWAESSAQPVASGTDSSGDADAAASCSGDADDKSAARQWWDWRLSLDAKLGKAVQQFNTLLQPVLQHCLPDTVQSDTASSSGSPLTLLLGPDLHSLPWECLLQLQHRPVYRLLHTQAMPASRNLHMRTPESAARSSACVVDASEAVYIVDPKGDLVKTRERFEGWFAALPGWAGSAGTPALPASQLRTQLAQKELFVFLGHGAGVVQSCAPVYVSKLCCQP